MKCSSSRSHLAKKRKYANEQVSTLSHILSLSLSLKMKILSLSLEMKNSRSHTHKCIHSHSHLKCIRNEEFSLTFTLSLTLSRTHSKAQKVKTKRTKNVVPGQFIYLPMFYCDAPEKNLKKLKRTKLTHALTCTMKHTQNFRFCEIYFDSRFTMLLRVEIIFRCLICFAIEIRFKFNFLKLQDFECSIWAIAKVGRALIFQTLKSTEHHPLQCRASSTAPWLPSDELVQEAFQLQTCNHLK